MTRPLRPEDYEDIVARALAEDLGGAGDITTDALVPGDATGTARIVARAPGVVAGLDVAAAAFRLVDPTIEIRIETRDGAEVRVGDVVATVRGRMRGILTAERTALNLLGRLSGVATLTRAYVEAVAGTGARIMDTRKTLPGFRALDKYAVRAGGGLNHRFGLYDAAMVKDNHVAAAGSIDGAVRAVRAAVGPDTTVVVEVDTPDQLTEALSSPADRVLLDNMDLETLAAAVRDARGRMETEASGGVTLETVRAIADTGVDVISVGALTHSAGQLDFALDVED